MKNLDFLAGTWVGDVRVHLGQGNPMELTQTEEAQYKLRNRTDGKPVFHALATVSYDEAARQYRMRAYSPRAAMASRGASPWGRARRVT